MISAPQIIFYVAGADPYREDQLGGVALTMKGLAQRDALVMDYARRNGCPVAITLAGGYARRVEDTVAIHVERFWRREMRREEAWRMGKADPSLRSG